MIVKVGELGDLMAAGTLAYCFEGRVNYFDLFWN